MSEVKLSLSVDEKTAERIERFRHKHRLSTRTEALRILVKQGLLELEDHVTDNPPSQKQIDLVKNLCKERGVEPPEVYSSKAFSYFISQHINNK